MLKLQKLVFTVVLCANFYCLRAPTAYGGSLNTCENLNVDPKASIPLKPRALLPGLGSCSPGSSNGFPIPDRGCSPGAVNPTVTLKILQTKGFTTGCLRNKASSSTEKAEVFTWYGISKPPRNHGPTQTCELDHIIPLELGGADTLDNIWPQCGPEDVGLEQRFFKQKDAVENFLKVQVKAGKISLEAAQRGIAEDWTQFLAGHERLNLKGD